MAPAISASLPLTDSMSISARSSVTGHPRGPARGMVRTLLGITGTEPTLLIFVDRRSDRPTRLPRMIDGATARPAWGWGLATVHESGQVLDTYFPSPALGRADDSDPPPELAAGAVAENSARYVTDVRRVEIDLDVPPAGASDAYLRLHLLSHRLVAPRSINLDGIFSPAAQRGLDLVRALCRRRLRAGALPAPRCRTARSPSTASTSSRG